MEQSQLRAELNTIYESQLDNPSGVTRSSMVEEFQLRFPDARLEVGAELFDDYLRRVAYDTLRKADAKKNHQIELPGFGHWDATVTTMDGEDKAGRRKRLEYATAPELKFDLELHNHNVLTAIDARNRAQDRNDTLLPIMEEGAFACAGDAIAFLRSESGES